MAANTAIGEIVATVLRNRARQFADNVSNGNALLAKLSQDGKVKYANGGRTIVQDLEYAENSTFMMYSGYDELTVSETEEVFDAAEYNWKQASVMVTASGLEVDVQATGPEAIIDLMDGRINNAMKTMRNQLSAQIYTGDDSSTTENITGLVLQVAADPTTGVIGGIDRATAGNEFWRNQTDQSAVAIDSTTIEGHMRSMWLACTRGPDVPDLIIGDSVMFELYWDSLATVQRINREDKGVRGWNSLAFVNADVLYDGGSGIQAKTMYFLNTDYIYWRPHPNVNMVPLTEREPDNKHSFQVPVVFAGNLTASNLSLQGNLADASA